MTTPASHIGGLIDGGDYACAHAYAGGLAEVCRELAALAPELAPLATAVAERTADDLAEATRLWMTLASELRRRGGRARA